MIKNSPRIKRNSRSYKILKTLAIGSGILVLSTISPASGAKLVKGIIAAYIRKKKFEKNRLLRDLKNLQERKLLEYRELQNGEVEMKITRQGQKVLLKYRIDEIKLKKPATWDKKWRLVMFDIPHEKRQARDAFRRKLKDLQFHQLQKSVFITPDPCEDEIDFIAEIFDIRKYILILYVNNFEGEGKLQHHFKIH